jgi:hypothetical protein
VTASRRPATSPVPAGRGLPDRAIFVTGMPRSGTSLMRGILGSHPDVAMFPGELPLWREIARAHAHRDLSRAGERERVIADLVAHPRVARARIALDGPAIVGALEAEPVVTLGTVFAHALRQYARQAGKPRWGAKDPRSEFYADAMLAELPAAGVVHMVRDPRDVLASQRAAWGRAAQHIVSTVDDWRGSVALARLRARERGAYVAVRYEDLVAEPARVVRDVCRALDLEFRAEMIDLAGSPLWPAAATTDRGAPRVAEAITARSVGRHRRDLHPGELRYIEWRARREMADWGYRTEPRRGGWARAARCLAEEGAWRAARQLGIWPVLARALGRLPSDRDGRRAFDRPAR